MIDQLMLLANRQASVGYNAMEPVSENFGNYGTYGYKAQRFEQFIRPDGAIDFIRRTDTSQGPLRITNREFDIAIKGPGWIAVTRKDGTQAYTRNGHFTRNGDGFLVTPFGDLIGSGIKIPPDYFRLQIEKNGKVMVMPKAGDVPQEIGQIPLVSFNNPEGLQRVGYNLSMPTPESGIPSKILDHKSVQQGMLETANFSIQSGVADLLRINTQVLSNLRITKLADEIYREGINLRQ